MPGIKKEEDTPVEIDEQDGPEVPDIPDTDIELAVGGGEPEEDEPEEKPSRRDRRNQRRDDLVEAANRRAEAAERMAQENAAALRQLATRPVYAQMPQAPQQDPYEVEWENMRQQQEGLQERFNTAQRAGDAAAAQRIQQESWQLRRAMDRNAFIRNMRELGVPQQPQQPGLSKEDLERTIVQRRFADEHPDIANDPKAAQAFSGNYQRFLAMGQQDGWELVNKVAEATRQDMRMQGKRPAPTAAERSRLTGMSVGSSGASRSGPKVVKMGKMQQRLADAAFPHIKDEAKRYQHWANTAGKNMTE